jgi:alpha-beta hydrolase superfamily lysophospholipase
MIAIMSTRFEGSFRAQDQTELFFQLWTVDAPRGTMVVTHGLAEHGECYHGLAKSLVADNWETYAIDLRGHGRSEGKRGFVRDFQDYVTDLRSFVELVVRQRKSRDVPLILFGHSMGGLLTTLVAMDWQQPPFHALILSSPLFGLSLPVPALKDRAARLAARWMPSLTLHNELKYKDLTRDEEMLRSYSQDVLRHDKISPAVYLGMQEAFLKVAAGFGAIDVPILLQVAGNDKIVNTRTSQDLFAQVTNKKCVMEIYPESFHEIYNDLDRDQALADLKKFINQVQVTT